MKFTMYAFCFLIVCNHLIAYEIDSVDGYPCCNFKIGANISAEGKIFGNIIHNPSGYGQWLSSLGNITASITYNTNSIEFDDFQNKTINRNWPFVKTEQSDPKINDIQVNTLTYAPIAYNDDFTSSLPFIISKIDFINSGDTKQLELNLQTSQYIDTPYYIDRSNKDFTMLCSGNKFVAVLHQKNVNYIIDRLSTPVILKPGEAKTIHIITGIYDDMSKSAQAFNSPQEILAYASDNLELLENKTNDFTKKLPVVNDREINRYLRWHMIPAVILTKTMKDGNVLTMGYSELNQRDSYWTSFAHLLLWPELEKKMIFESIEHQRNDGKIPTTILPTIERNDDIDITCYFILRAARYYNHHKDSQFLKYCYPAMKNAIGFLKSLDINNQGMPQQHSFWADWKDVNGIEGRKYAPHMAFTYLAALKEMINAAKILEYSDDAEVYQAMYTKADKLINLPVESGGLWNGKFYQQTWNDTAKNQTNKKLLQDQVVGIVFDVMPKERATLVLNALDASITEYGTAETMPFYPDSFGYPQGCYHNGGMWPYLNYIHSWALLKSGRTDDGINLMKKCAKATLENNNKYLPYEYINSINGSTGGHCIQGWNADFLAAVYFGILQN